MKMNKMKKMGLIIIGFLIFGAQQEMRASDGLVGVFAMLENDKNKPTIKVIPKSEKRKEIGSKMYYYAIPKASKKKKVKKDKNILSFQQLSRRIKKKESGF